MFTLHEPRNLFKESMSNNININKNTQNINKIESFILKK